MLYVSKLGAHKIVRRDTRGIGMARQDTNATTVALFASPQVEEAAVVGARRSDKRGGHPSGRRRWSSELPEAEHRWAQAFAGPLSPKKGLFHFRSGEIR